MAQPTITLKQIHRALSASGWRDVPPEAFDHWLALHDAEVSAQALAAPDIDPGADQAAGAARALVEIPGADGDHAAAAVLNAAIEWENASQNAFDVDTLIRAADELHAAVRAYLPLVTS